jgi:hypothetical protein
MNSWLDYNKLQIYFVVLGIRSVLLKCVTNLVHLIIYTVICLPFR